MKPYMYFSRDIAIILIGFTIIGIVVPYLLVMVHFWTGGDKHSAYIVVPILLGPTIPVVSLIVAFTKIQKAWYRLKDRRKDAG